MHIHPLLGSSWKSCSGRWCRKVKFDKIWNAALLSHTCLSELTDNCLLRVFLAFLSQVFNGDSRTRRDSYKGLSESSRSCSQQQTYRQTSGGAACYLTSTLPDQREREEEEIKWQRVRKRRESAGGGGRNICTFSQRWRACRQLRTPVKRAPRHNETLMKLRCCWMVPHGLWSFRDRDWPEHAWRRPFQPSLSEHGETLKKRAPVAQLKCVAVSDLPAPRPVHGRVFRAELAMREGVMLDLSLSWFNWWACQSLVK